MNRKSVLLLAVLCLIAGALFGGGTWLLWLLIEGESDWPIVYAGVAFAVLFFLVMWITMNAMIRKDNRQFEAEISKQGQTPLFAIEGVYLPEPRQQITAQLCFIDERLLLLTVFGGTCRRTEIPASQIDQILTTSTGAIFLQLLDQSGIAFRAREAADVQRMNEWLQESQWLKK